MQLRPPFNIWESKSLSLEAVVNRIVSYTVQDGSGLEEGNGNGGPYEDILAKERFACSEEWNAQTPGILLRTSYMSKEKLLNTEGGPNMG